MSKSVIPEWVIPDVTKFSCRIGGPSEKRFCPEAVLHVTKGGEQFICQNVWNGNKCYEPHPYTCTFQINMHRDDDICDKVYDIKRLRKMNHE
jgi:hypothetical protein